MKIKKNYFFNTPHLLFFSFFCIIVIFYCFYTLRSNKQETISKSTNSFEFTTAIPKSISEKIDYYMGSESNLFCNHLEYGRDDMYIYTWMFCSDFTDTNGIIALDRGFSIATRFEYDKESETILSHKQPSDGSYYDSSLTELFPNPEHRRTPSNEELTKLQYQNKLGFLYKTNPNIIINLDKITQKYPKFKDWDLQSSFSGKSTVYKEKNNTYYFAFITHGSGVPIVDVACFSVSDENIIETQKFGISNNTKTVDPFTCKGVDTF